jgi:uncharacterized protein YdgA (DUF945 family)
MKKLVLVVLLVGIVGVAALSAWGSLRAKQAYRDLILAISESPDMRIIDTDYERGWLESSYRASVEIRGPLGESFQQWMLALGHDEVRERLGIRIRQDIEHGYVPLVDWLTSGMEGMPVVGRVETHLELDQETQSELSAVIGRLPPVSISTVIRVSGVGESFVTIPVRILEGKLAIGEGGTWAARWEGLRGQIVHTLDFDRFAASLQSGGLEGRIAGSAFAVRDLTWTADLTRDESGLLVGELSSSVGSLRLSSPDEGAPAFQLDQWVIRQSASIEAGSFGSTLALGVRAIRVGDAAFGPGEVQLRLRDLDARSLARLQRDGVAGLTPSDPHDTRQVATEEGAGSVISALVSRSPQLEIRALRLATPSGDIQARLRIDLDGSRPDLLYSAHTLLPLFRVEAEFECPREILDGLYREREEELLELRREGWILLQGDRYRGRLKLEEGELLVNGIPRTLEGLPGQRVAPESLPRLSAAPSGPVGIATASEVLP